VSMVYPGVYSTGHGRETVYPPWYTLYIPRDTHYLALLIPGV